MVYDTTRRAVLTATVLVVALGVLAGSAAALDSTADEDEDSIDLEIDVDADLLAGDLEIDCDGDGIEAHHCDKTGSLDAGPFGLDYVGYNGGVLGDATYELGDEIVLEVDGEEYGIEFDCDTEDGCDGGLVTPEDGTADDGSAIGLR